MNAKYFFFFIDKFIYFIIFVFFFKWPWIHFFYYRFSFLFFSRLFYNKCSRVFLLVHDANCKNRMKKRGEEWERNEQNRNELKSFEFKLDLWECVVYRLLFKICFECFSGFIQGQSVKISDFSEEFDCVEIRNNLELKIRTISLNNCRSAEAS